MDIRGNVTREKGFERDAIEGDDRSSASLEDSWFDWPRTPPRASPQPRGAPPRLGDGLADRWFV
jgi:hypothetical protein